MDDDVQLLYSLQLSFSQETQVVHGSCTMATRAAILRVYSGHFGLEHSNC